jgi:hypothetical protein
MSQETLQHLIAEAQALAGDHPCSVLGHAWRTCGGRRCPRGSEACSQAAYECAKCGEFDYGEPGGPGFEDCKEPCDQSCADALYAEISDSLWHALGSAA